jgi:hypothetical protein
MSDGTDTEVYERLNLLERSESRTDVWKDNMFERVKKMEDVVSHLEKGLVKSEVRLTIVIGVLIFVANWVFKHF